MSLLFVCLFFILRRLVFRRHANVQKTYDVLLTSYYNNIVIFFFWGGGWGTTRAVRRNATRVAVAESASRPTTGEC